jgi:hypothetical protein
VDHQVRDYGPPISPSGLFWVTRIPGDTVDVELESGKASMELQNFMTSDWGNILHNLRNENPLPAAVSFSVVWQKELQRLALRDPQNGFEGRFVETQALVQWTATQKGFTFVSDPLETSTSSFAVIGHERNGVFFR